MIQNPRSGISDHLNLLLAAGKRFGSACEHLMAAAAEYGTPSHVSSAWKEQYNAWARKLSCAKLPFTSHATGTLSTNDVADVPKLAALYGGSAPPAPPGGPPISDREDITGGTQNLFGLSRPKVKPWGQVALNVTPGDVLRLAKEDDSKWVNVGQIVSGAGYASSACLRGLDGNANWGGFDGNKWEVPGTGDGPDGVYECDVIVRRDTLANQQGANHKDVVDGDGENGTAIGPVGPVTGGGGGLGELLGAGVAPNIVRLRRCPGGMRLAYNGMCYSRKVLPPKFYMNRSKPAPVPWSAAQQISKGRAAAKRIAKYAETHDIGEHHHRHRTEHHHKEHHHHKE